MELDEGLKLAYEGRALLFLGAGFPLGAISVSGQPFSAARGLGKLLAAEINIPNEFLLEDIAEMYADQLGEQRLFERMEELFTANQVAKHHIAIASLPWRQIYTTNYDDVFEKACASIKKRMRAVTPSDAIAQHLPNSSICIHLNGAIVGASPESIWEEIKLTATSYTAGPALNDAWANRFRFDLHAAQAIFFVGYSLADLDLKRILREEALAEKSLFVLGNEPDLATLHRANSYGNVIAKNADEFADQVEQFGKTYKPSNNAAPAPFCLPSYEPDPNRTPLEDRFIFDLLLYGKVRTNFVAAGLLGATSYCQYRDAIDLALKRIVNRDRVVILHSTLGNGKTILLEQLKFLVHAKGMPVYTLAERGESFEEELHYLLGRSQHAVIFVDNYPEWLDVAGSFGANRAAPFTLVCTARTSSHEGLAGRFYELLNVANGVEIDANQLSDADLRIIIKFFEQYAISGEFFELGESDKLRYLRERCEGEWRGILFRLLQAPQVVDRLKIIYGGLQRKSVYLDPLVRLMVLSVIGYHPSISDQPALCGDAILERGFKRDAVVGEMLSAQGKMRSSVLAEALLKSTIDPNQTAQSVISLIRVADEMYSSSAYHEGLFKSLIRFSNSHMFFDEKSRGRSAMKVYEEVKDCEHCHRNPLFWLQYAIAALVAKDYARTKQYCDASYAFAKDTPWFDTFQIDNHYARYLLEKVVVYNESRDCMTLFREAYLLLAPQLAKDTKHYPFRVATQWLNFVLTFKDVLKPMDKEFIAKVSRSVIERILQLPEDAKTHRSVQECLVAQREVVQILAPTSEATGTKAKVSS